MAMTEDERRLLEREVRNLRSLHARMGVERDDAYYALYLELDHDPDLEPAPEGVVLRDPPRRPAAPVRERPTGSPSGVLGYLRRFPIAGVDVGFMERSMAPGANWFTRADVAQRDLIIAELVRRLDSAEQDALDRDLLE